MPRKTPKAVEPELAEAVEPEPVEPEPVAEPDVAEPLSLSLAQRKAMLVQIRQVIDGATVPALTAEPESFLALAAELHSAAMLAEALAG